MARETTNQQTTQEPRNQQYTMGDRQQGAGARQQDTGASHGAQQSSTAGGMTTAERGDRERSLATTRETGTGRGSTGVARRQGYAPGSSRGVASDPFTLMQRMAEDMDRLFDQFGFGRSGLGLMSSGSALLGSGTRDSGSLLGRGASSLWSPQVEVFRRGDQLVVRADVPGVNKDDLHVDVEDDVLTIRGERRDEREEREEGFYRSERSYGEFYRAIPLPEGTDAERCEATYENGVLEVTLPVPKQEERKRRRIPVR